MIVTKFMWKLMYLEMMAECRDASVGRMEFDGAEGTRDAEAEQG
jgi:hypothetical protein